MVKIEWDDEGIKQAAKDVVTAQTHEMQNVLDSLRESEQGKDVASVAATLQSRWQQDFGTPFPYDLLTPCAAQLAAGTRVVLNLKHTET